MSRDRILDESTGQKVREIRERVVAAADDGWYGYDEEARADVTFLLNLVEPSFELCACAHSMSDHDQYGCCYAGCGCERKGATVNV